MPWWWLLLYYLAFMIPAAAQQHAVIPLSPDQVAAHQQAWQRASSCRESVESLSQQCVRPLTAGQSTSAQKAAVGVMVFASLSMPRTSLRQLLQQSVQYQVPVMIRGVLPGGFKATLTAIKAVLSNQTTAADVSDWLPGGLGIDPWWFNAFGIEQVPAFVVVKPGACEPKQSCSAADFDVLYGNVSLPDALRILATQGTVKTPAVEALQRGGGQR